MSGSESTPRQFGDRFTAVADAARQIQTACRTATASVFARDASVRRIGKRLDLGTNLAWKVFRLLQVEDASDIISVIPGRRGQMMIVESLRDMAEDRDIDALHRAFEAYERTLADLDIDSRELAIMAGGALNDAATSRQLEEASKRIFDGYALLRGQRIDLALVGAIASPSPDDPEMLDIVGYELFHGITRLRPGGPIRLRNAAWARDREWHVRATGDVSVVAEASTPDLGPEEIKVVRDRDQSAVYADPSGDRTEPITVAFMQVFRKLSCIHRDTGSRRPRRLGYHANCSPIRQVMVEYLQPSTLPKVIHASGTTDFTFTQGATLESTIPYDRIPFAVEPASISTPTLPALESAQPFHRRLVEAAAAEFGLDPDALSGHRLVHEHLPMSASITLSWDPPDDPAAAAPTA